MSMASMVAKGNQTVQFERATKVKTPTGAERIAGWNDHGLPLPCWKQPAPATVREQYATRQIPVSHAIYLASDPLIREGDRAVIAGQTFKVQGFYDFAGLGQGFRVDAEEQQLNG